MKRSVIKYGMQSTTVMRGVPWKIDPIKNDADFMPFDRLIRKLYLGIVKIRDAIGVAGMKKWRTLNRVAGDVESSRTKMLGVFEGTDTLPMIEMEPEGPNTLDDFTINSDQVLGGHSEAFLDLTEDNFLLFHGTLRVTRDPIKMATSLGGTDLITDDHTGYAHFDVKYYLYRTFAVQARGVEVRVRGSQHPFMFRMRVLTMGTHEMWAHMFVPTDEFRSYILRFDHMRHLRAGQEINGNQVLGDERFLGGGLDYCGFGINCGEESDFWLEVEYVRWVSSTTEEIQEMTHDEAKVSSGIYRMEHMKYGKMEDRKGT